MKRALAGTLAVLLSSLTFASAGSVDAQEQPLLPDRTAWWFELQQLPGLTIPPLVAVPEGGILVQHVIPFESPSIIDVLPAGFLSGTIAFGAVRYTVEPRSTGTLRLDVGVGTALTAQLRICQTITAWNADPPPGLWFARPRFDTGLCTPGVVAADGTSVTFEVPEELTRDGVLDVAVVPENNAIPTVVIFAKPAPDALQVTAPDPDVPLPPIVPPVEAIAPTVPVGGPIDVALPTVPAAPAITPTAPRATSVRLPDPEPVRGSGAAAVALGALLLGWVGFGRKKARPPRSLLRLDQP